MFSFQIVDGIRRQSSWASCEFSRPTHRWRQRRCRRDSTVKLRRRRRCVLYVLKWLNACVKAGGGHFEYSRGFTNCLLCCQSSIFATQPFTHTLLTLKFDALKQVLVNVNINTRPCNYVTNRVLKCPTCAFTHAPSRLRKLKANLRIVSSAVYARSLAMRLQWAPGQKATVHKATGQKATHR